jgi:hypothetical protein
MSYSDDLRECLGHLAEAYDSAKANIEKNHPGINPLIIQDVNGRLILLDSLTAIVNAQTALVGWAKA